MPASSVDLLIRRVGRLATPRGDKPLKGRQADHVSEHAACAVTVSKGRFVQILPEKALPRGLTPSREIDAEGCLATPGLVDPHTHLVFSGSRAKEFESRLRGASYLEIAAKGGGIQATVRAVRRAGEEALFREAQGRLSRMLAQGTCIAEVKSGYGLDLETELKILRVVDRLRRAGPQEIVPTFLGAHALPPEHAKDRRGFVDLVAKEMLPRVARERLAEFCDVFCESGAFTVEESRAILEAARQAGLALKIHAEQFTRLGGTRLACSLEAASADHLACVGDEEIAALAKALTVAVVLPGSALMTGSPPYAYPRRLLDGGAAVAIATDCNPGTSHLESMPLAMALACAIYKMTPAEVLTAATLNAACAVGRGHAAGSVEPGKRADLVLWEAEEIREIPYRFGQVPIKRVICKGLVVEGEVFSGEDALDTKDENGAFVIWVDGASRGNPGPAAAGVVIETAGGRTLLDEGFALGETTNNVAEYSALLKALEEAERLGAKSLRIHADSELLVKQIKGEYKVRHANLKPLHEEAKKRLSRFADVQIRHVRREQNTRADAAANRALDKA